MCSSDLKDVILVGSSFKEGTQVATHNNTKGIARAFDVRTGKMLWAFNTIPRPGEFGNDTWENDSWAVNGNAGVWTQITVDEEAGLVYLPVEDPTSDQYGGHRPGNNLFADTLVCVDLKTGIRKWHFQVAHHPIWDYDLSSAPLLAEVAIVACDLAELVGSAIALQLLFGLPLPWGVALTVADTLLLLALRTRLLGRASPYVGAAAFSATLLLHFIAGSAETLTRLPPGAPLLHAGNLAIFGTIVDGLVALFLAGVAAQCYRIATRPSSPTRG